MKNVWFVAGKNSDCGILALITQSYRWTKGRNERKIKIINELLSSTELKNLACTLYIWFWSI